jgi:Zn-dependent protease with chaperone function
MVLSPWLLDWLLGKFLAQKELSKEKLNSYSREALRVLQRTCQQRRWPCPQLRILPISAPIIISYGNLPRTARITVSQGLLEQLANDEIAAIYALTLGQIGRWDFVVMSLILLVTLPFYGLYLALPSHSFSGYYLRNLVSSDWYSLAKFPIQALS